MINSTAYSVAPRPGLEPGTCGLTASLARKFPLHFNEIAQIFWACNKTCNSALRFICEGFVAVPEGLAGVC